MGYTGDAAGEAGARSRTNQPGMQTWYMAKNMLRVGKLTLVLNPEQYMGWGERRISSMSEGMGMLFSLVRTEYFT